jgi:hypothetical protein
MTSELAAVADEVSGPAAAQIGTTPARTTTVIINSTILFILGLRIGAASSRLKLSGIPVGGVASEL